MIRINELQTQTLETLTAEILILKRQTAANIIEIGKRLIEAKKLVGHGNWLAYLEEKVQFSRYTASRFMRAAEEFSNVSPVTHLEPSKVYLLLEAPPEDRDALAERAANMSKRELEAAVREANRLRKEAEEAKRRAAEAEAKAKELANRPPQVVERTVEVVKPDPELARKHAEMRKEYDQVVRRLAKHCGPRRGPFCPSARVGPPPAPETALCEGDNGLSCHWVWSYLSPRSFGSQTLVFAWGKRPRKAF